MKSSSLSKLFAITFIAASLAHIAPVMAEDKKIEGQPPAEQLEEKRESVAQSVYQKVKAFKEGLSKNEAAHFDAIYASHNIIAVVEMVKDDVENAIDECSDKNPDMKGALNDRYDAWEDAIEPILKDAKANVDNMIKAQDYRKKGEFNDLFDFIEDAREETVSEIDKIPVTTPEACEYLRNKMDETQDNLTKLLQNTLIALPQSLQNAQDEEAAAAEAKAKEEEEKAKAEEEKAKAEAAQAEEKAKADEKADEDE